MTETSRMATRPFDRNLHHRRSIRLPNYDYSQAGAYFVTIVCKDHALLLEDPALHAFVEDAWLWLARQYAYVHIDEYAIMPNHLHGILVIRDARRGGSRTALTDAAKRKPLGRLIGAFKTVSTKRINTMRGTRQAQIWQRNYYERVIRDEDELNRVRKYIKENPLRWEDDPENPERQRASHAQSERTDVLFGQENWTQ